MLMFTSYVLNRHTCCSSIIHHMSIHVALSEARSVKGRLMRGAPSSTSVLTRPKGRLWLHRRSTAIEVNIIRRCPPMLLLPLNATGSRSTSCGGWRGSIHIRRTRAPPKRRSRISSRRRRRCGTSSVVVVESLIEAIGMEWILKLGGETGSRRHRVRNLSTLHGNVAARVLTARVGTATSQTDGGNIHLGFLRSPPSLVEMEGSIGWRCLAIVAIVNGRLAVVVVVIMVGGDVPPNDAPSRTILSKSPLLLLLFFFLNHLMIITTDCTATI